MAEMFITPIQLMDPVGQTVRKSEAETAARDVISSFKGIFENTISKTTQSMMIAKIDFALFTEIFTELGLVKKEQEKTALQ